VQHNLLLSFVSAVHLAIGIRATYLLVRVWTSVVPLGVTRNRNRIVSVNVLYFCGAFALLFATGTIAFERSRPFAPVLLLLPFRLVLATKTADPCGPKNLKIDEARPYFCR